MTSNVTLTLNLTAKTGRVTDSTDYSLLNIDVSTMQVKALATIKFQGDIIVTKDTVGNPLIDLQSGATYYDFPLELDTNGDVAYGTYEIVGYQVVIVQSLTTVAGDQTLFFQGADDTSASITEGDEIVIPSGTNAGTYTAVEATYASGYLIITVEESTTAETSITIDTSIYLNPTLSPGTTYTYSGCTQITASTGLTADCDYGDNGTWTVTNETLLTTQTVSALEATINYPSWTGEAAIVATSLPYVNNRLATGTYSVVLTETITQTETDGLILQYTITSTQEFPITCSGSLCSLMACYENLRAANAGALASSKVSQYQESFDNATSYIIQYQEYKNCGDTESATIVWTSLKEVLDAFSTTSGCGCSTATENSLFWVYNTSSEAQTAIEELQVQVAALENPTVFNKVLFDSVFPIRASDGLLPNDPTYYRPFTDISDITIDKEYFTTNENGYPKYFIQIDIGVWTENQSYLLNVFNITTSDNIAPGMTVSAVEGETRLTLKLFTYQAGTAAVLQFCTAEGFTIDNGTSPKVCTNHDYVENSDIALWDTVEDLNVSFVPFDTSSMGFTYFRITAIAQP